MKEILRVTVAGVIVPVYRATSKEILDLKDDDGTDLCGCFLETTGTIYILSGQPKTLERDTINHEILHAWIYFSGAREVMRRLMKRPDDIHEAEETLARVLTPHIHLIDWCK